MKTMALAFGMVLAAAPLQVQAQTRVDSSLAVARSDDEKAVRAIVAHLEAEEPDPHVSPSLDWENAFGIRYHDLKKRDAFYSEAVKPQFRSATDNTLETKVQFIAPNVAVADAYWHVVGQIYGGETKPGPDRWGRTTYIFEKRDGAWTEVIERVADLRLPHYDHIDAIPPAAKVSPGVLQSYAGRYTRAPGAADPRTVEVSVTGDHLTLTSTRGNLIAIPTSDTDFLVFYKLDDTAEYYKATFALRDGVASYTLREAWGAPLGTLQRTP